MADIEPLPYKGTGIVFIVAYYQYLLSKAFDGVKCFIIPSHHVPIQQAGKHKDKDRHDT